MSRQMSQLEDAMNRRQFLKVAGGSTLGLAALLAGCGTSTGSSPTSSNGSVTIHFLSVQAAGTGWPLVLSTITDQYAKTKPGSTFKVDFQDQASLNQKIQLLAGQGALPVLYNTPPADLLAQLAKNGEVLDIESTFNQLGVTQELVPAAVTLLKKVYNGKLSALPFELNIEGFWYNKQIFAQNGLQPPQTWDELVQIAASLQQKGIQPFAASGKQGWPLTRLVGNYIFRSLGPDALQSVQSGQAKLTDAAYVAAAQAVANLGKQGYFGKGVATLDYMPAVDLFLQGTAAMLYMGSWELRDFNSPTVNKIGASNIGFFPFPNVTGGVGNSGQTPMNAGQPTSVNKAKYNADVGKWLAYMAQNYGDVALQKEGAVTGFVVHHPPANLDALTSLVIAQIKQVTQPVLWFEALFSTKAQNISQQNAALLVTNAMSGSNFMAAIQQAS
ncbi:MAG: extracellular solute-binding protein [Chloroflexi bacterium]|nr:MAG: extracellular solute-binding protein [Chloroflexota bacterium]